MNDKMDTKTSEEILAYCCKEYESKNPITKLLINNFFNKINLLLKIIGPNKRLLEVGCGAAESSKRIYSKLVAQEFEASEFDERYINELSKQHLPFKVTQESVYSLKRDSNEFDCVLLLEVLEHLEAPDQAIKEIFRVTKRFVIISVPNEPLWRILNFIRGKYWKSLGNTPGHINHFSVSSIKKLLQPFAVSLKSYNSIPWIIILAEKK